MSREGKLRVVQSLARDERAGWWSWFRRKVFEFSEEKNLRELWAALATKTASKRAVDCAAFGYVYRHQEHLDASIKPLQLVGFPNERRYAT
jgi:hypothetical protein